MRTITGFGILAAQILLIARAQLGGADRYFCWAMFHSMSEYRIEATIAGRKLSPEQVRARYWRPAVGREGRSIQHVKNVIIARESGAADGAMVTLIYRQNGGPEEAWTWPQR